MQTRKLSYTQPAYINNSALAVVEGCDCLTIYTQLHLPSFSPTTTETVNGGSMYWYG
jgi:hypothetical protein